MNGLVTRLARAKERAWNNFPISVLQFGEGLQTPPSARPQVFRLGVGWRPSVARVARSGDLATTWSLIAWNPGDCSRPGPKCYTSFDGTFCSSRSLSVATRNE